MAISYDEALEKAQMLMSLLDELEHTPGQKGRFALHGGMALNGFLFPMPRLSTDIDLSLLGEYSTDEMPDIREEAITIVRNAAQRNGCKVHATKGNAAAGKTLRLDRGDIQTKADIVFMNRITIREPMYFTSTIDNRTMFKILDPCDLFGGKCKALFDRTKARDLFDIYTISSHFKDFNNEHMHSTLLLYSCLSKSYPHSCQYDFKEVIKGRIDEFKADYKESLLPMVNTQDVPSIGSLFETALEFIEQNVNPRTENDLGFMTYFRRGNYKPELLFDDTETVVRAKYFPEAMWKTQNLTQYYSKYKEQVEQDDTYLDALRAMQTNKTELNNQVGKFKPNLNPSKKKSLNIIQPKSNDENRGSG